MRKVSFVSGVILVVALSGCSSKPDASDVKDGIIEYWSPCKLVKVTDIKKTNGIERGNSYQMAISYKLELLQDVTAENVWRSVWSEHGLDGLKESSPEYDEKRNKLIAENDAGESRRIKFLTENCPGPVADHQGFDVAFMEAFRNQQNSSLKKGETVELTPEVVMIKSENGWVLNRVVGGL